MSHNLLGVYGASGFGREVMPMVNLQSGNESAEKPVFVDDNFQTSELNSYPVLSFEQFIKDSNGNGQLAIAIADGAIRRKLVEKLYDEKIGPLNVFANNSVRFDNVELGDHHIICSFVTLTSNIRIGIGFHANIYSYVAHDCVIGDYVTFAPGVMCNGNVVIEDGAYIGTGAIIKQGAPDSPLVIGAGAVVGMGAVVTKSVAPNTIVIGNPAKPMQSK